MSDLLVFVASETPLTDKHIRRAREIAQDYGMTVTGTPVWLEKETAAEITLTAVPMRNLIDTLHAEFAADKIDVLTTPTANRAKKLLMADMESTIVDKEALDELAEFAGIREQIAGITERAMNGELDFLAALNERVALLKNMNAANLQRVLDSMNINPGAKQMVATMTKNGSTCVLVSGGFTFFTGPIANKTGFRHHHGNELEIENGVLTGKVIPPVLDKAAKLSFLDQYAKDLNLTRADVMAIGDGANDLPMLLAAGLGVGYRPKPAVAKEVTNLILYGDFRASLYIQGYRGFLN